MTCAMCAFGFAKGTHPEPSPGSFRCAHPGCGRLCVNVINGAIHMTKVQVGHKPVRP